MPFFTYILFVIVSLFVHACAVGEMPRVFVPVFTEVITTDSPFVVFVRICPTLIVDSFVSETYTNDSPAEAGAVVIVVDQSAADDQDSLKRFVAAEPAPLYIVKTKSYVPSVTFVPSVLT